MPKPGERSRADLQARWNVLSVRRDELARRYPGSFHLSGDPGASLGARAPPTLAQEWERLVADLATLDAQLNPPAPDAAPPAALRASDAGAGRSP